MTIFFRLVSEDRKEDALKASLRDLGNALTFDVDCQTFRHLPGSPFAYWLPGRLIAKFREWPAFESGGRTATAGLHTANDERFLRLYYETPLRDSDRQDWVPLMKGGQAIPFFVDPITSVRWSENGHELKTFATSYRERKGWGGSWTAMINGTDYYFRPGFSWTLRASRFAPVAMPAGCAFSKRGCGGIAPEDDLPWLIAVTSSSCFDILFKTLLARAGHPEFASGALQKVPLPIPTESEKVHLADLFRAAWMLSRATYTSRETSRAFILPEVLLSRKAIYLDATKQSLAKIQQQIDERGQHLYGIDDEEIRMLMELLINSGSEDTAEDYDDDGDAVDAYDVVGGGSSNRLDMFPVVSWAVGVAFGRFDARLATGEREVPPEPAPFDDLPTRSPGMLPQGDLPIGAAAGLYVGDPGHDGDISAVAGSVLEHVQVDVPENLDSWLSRSFFRLHIAMYSEANRKAPIYWQLATPLASYSIWLYYHGLTNDTFYKVFSDYVEPKLQHEERRLRELLPEGGESPNAGQRRQIAEQETFVEELRAFREEVARIAPLWKPNHDDGVIINFAPLWRLVPQHRAWQRECMVCWDKLGAGEYDWSHLAMHLWPERVVPKCARDRSLAIAHGLEDRLWVEDLEGRWRPRQSLDATVRYLEKQLLSKTLVQMVAELEAFSKEHAAGSGRSWWHALLSGDHDDHPLALSLWPERVPSRTRGSRPHKPRHDQGELALLASFCDHGGAPSDWSQRWAGLHAGMLDEEPIARFLYPPRVIERAQQDQDFAARHELAGWFWLDERQGSRRLMEPEQEQAAAVMERESPAVKAALKSLLEAPPASGGGSGRARGAPRRRRRAAGSSAGPAL
jgi:hypothetical protein